MGKHILKALIFIASFVTWDLYLKDVYYGWIASRNGAVGLAEVAAGYAIPFLFAFVTTEILVRKLRLLEEQESGTGFE